MKERKIKVYESPGLTGSVPRILLQGKWLEQLGYNIGDHVTIRYDQKKLIVERIPNAQ